MISASPTIFWSWVEKMKVVLNSSRIFFISSMTI